MGGLAVQPIGDARIALNDDYLKFLRWAVWKVVEQPEGARHGIVAFVTNHGFINGRIHRGVRKALLDAFDGIWVFNLQGNQRLWVKGVQDEKVFPDVQQGVALTVLVRKGSEHAGPATVHYREMRGTREAKYRAAEQLLLTDEGWTKVAPEAPYWSFAPNDADSRYDTWPSVPDIFPTSTSGVQSSHDDLVSDFTPGPIADRMRQIEDRRIPDQVFEERFKISRNPRWVWSAHRAAFRGFDETKTIPWLYRLFDRRYIYWDPVFVEWPRLKVMRHLLPRPFGYGGEHRLALVVQRAGPKPTDALCTVARGIACAHVTSQWNHVYPFRLADPVEEGHLPFGSDQWAENVNTDFAAALERSYGRRPRSRTSRGTCSGCCRRLPTAELSRRPSPSTTPGFRSHRESPRSTGWPSSAGALGRHASSNPRCMTTFASSAKAQGSSSGSGTIPTSGLYGSTCRSGLPACRSMPGHGAKGSGRWSTSSPTGRAARLTPTRSRCSRVPSPPSAHRSSLRHNSMQR